MKLGKITIYLSTFLQSGMLLAQSITPDLQNPGLWQMVNREVTSVSDGLMKAVRFSEKEDDGLMILKDFEFSNGTVELDIKGRNKLQQSFVGLAFHVVNDSTFDAIYFRPFNFKNEEVARRSRAVQYISNPKYDWPILRQNFPGKYENRVNPVPDPDDWFHVKLIILDKSISVFINHVATPSLQIEKLSDVKAGRLALWVGNGSDGSFANLVITPEAAKEKIPYGNNPKVGKYLIVGDARLYYEIYGEGKPIVLLHGGVYGYIDEFEPFIEKLSQTNQVICIGTRGHGKSEIGHEPFTWKQRADDAYKVIRSITSEKIMLLGFSDGAATAFKLAALHPETVECLVAIGFGNTPKGSRTEKFSYSSEMLLKNAPDLFASRKALMPERERWGECLSKLNKLYNDDFLSSETFGKITCNTLVMGGEKDEYHTPERIKEASDLISNSKFSIIENCGHVVFNCKFDEVWQQVVSFLAVR